jgi:putative oxidoreductase
MSILVLAGRVLFVVIFLYSSMNHLTKTRIMAGYAKSKRVPLPRLTTFVSGVLLLVGAAFVLLGIWADAGALLLALFLLPTALWMHGFWHERGAGRGSSRPSSSRTSPSRAPRSCWPS